jgi:hypothetical protein
MVKKQPTKRFVKIINNICRFIVKNSRVLVLIFGSLSVSAWTMVRFFLKPSTFDLAGQQVLIRQWLNGFHSGATLGPTNYILKMLVIYAPFQWLPGSARTKLVAMTLLINIITFVLIVLLLEKLIKQFFPKIEKSFYLVCLWLSLIAGSMYWIQFSNSRNLEVIGGLLFIYLAFKYIRRSSIFLFVSMVVLLSLLMFADPLQLYMSVLPMLLFGFILYLHEKHDRRRLINWVALVSAVVIGFLGSRLLTLVAKRIWNVSFIAVTTHTNGLSLTNTVVHGIVPAVKQIARLYVGGYEYGRNVEALNLLFVIGILVIGLWYILKKLLPIKFTYFVLSFWLLDIGFFIASGQALQNQTSRYLIMTIPIFILFLAAILSIKTKLRKLLLLATVIVIGANSITLTKILAENWNTSFNKDDHVYSVISYMGKHNYLFAYSSMDSALPADYFSNGRVSLLPLNCTGSTLSPSYLFFDKAFFDKTADSTTLVVPLILDGNQIENNPSVCSLQNIEAQFGNWQATDKLSDGSVILLYNTSQLNTALSIKP